MLDRDLRKAERQSDVLSVFNNLRRSDRPMDARRYLEIQAGLDSEPALDLLNQEFPIHYSLQSLAKLTSRSLLVHAIQALAPSHDPRLQKLWKTLIKRLSGFEGQGRMPWVEGLIERDKPIERLRFAVQHNEWNAFGTAQLLPDEARELLATIESRMKRANTPIPRRERALLECLWLCRFLPDDEAQPQRQSLLQSWSDQLYCSQNLVHPPENQALQAPQWLPWHLSPSFLRRYDHVLQSWLITHESIEENVSALHPELQELLRDHWILNLQIAGFDVFAPPQRLEQRSPTIYGFIKEVQDQFGDRLFAQSNSQSRYFLILQQHGPAAARKLEALVEEFRQRRETNQLCRIRCALINTENDPTNAFQRVQRALNQLAEQRLWNSDEAV